MSLLIGGKTWEAPAPAPLDLEAAEERAVELLQSCHEAVCLIHKLERRLDKRWAWLQKRLDERDTALWKERNALVHDDFAAKHGAWRKLVKASTALHHELSKWPKKQREHWCACWGVEYPCEMFPHQIESDLEWTPWASWCPF